MPMHDWTRVTAGTFHAFHNAWITHLQEALNGGLLPPSYYALGEHASGDIGPDLLTLREAAASDGDGGPAEPERGLIAVASAPPQVQVAQEASSDMAYYLARRRTLVIRHASGDRIVALIEIVSPANKHRRLTVDRFVDKVIAAVENGIHVLLVDPFPPGRHDANGMHAAVWHDLAAEEYELPPGKPLTLASYCAKQPVAAYMQPLGVQDALTSMPLFLRQTHYVPVPLEATYMQSWSGVPERWRRVIVG